MKKILVVCFAFLSSCAPLNQDFVKALDSYTKVILPEYKNYVQADTSLNDETKAIRMQTAERFQILIDSAGGVK